MQNDFFTNLKTRDHELSIICRPLRLCYVWSDFVARLPQISRFWNSLRRDVECKKVKADTALHIRATGRHLPYGITQCYLPPDTSEPAPHLSPAMQAGTRFTYAGGMEGW